MFFHLCQDGVRTDGIINILSVQNQNMSVGEIVFVIGFASLFILVIYKTMTLDPNRKPRVWPMYQKIFVIVACIGGLAVAWLIVPECSMASKFLLTVYPILYIYRALKGWLFQSKDRLPPPSSQSPDWTGTHSSSIIHWNWVVWISPTPSGTCFHLEVFDE